MDLKIWVSALGTLCIYSLVLYKENKLYRVAETVLVAAVAANCIVVTFNNYIRPTVVSDIIRDGKYWRLVPILIGLLVYTRFIKPISWLQRIPIGFWIGVSSAYILTRNPGLFLSQVKATFLSLSNINNIIFVLGVVSAIAYFYFSVSLKNPLMKGASNIGRTFLLVAFGASFANMVMTRISTLLGRVQFLLQDCLRVIK